ncbi:META domain-containing protein [Shewanella sp. Isolate11]|uniref:META domain-containing protein n=1 Tax=Shewanella sp. Isolate11 TaxID=2908530 RepID=UPI001EFC56E5|nr:META domain-containing protein [Shewanella sp. Isolate11]MCG9695714.1 META domain-containing protein [Shewanella sp. Isolate11]
MSKQFLLAACALLSLAACQTTSTTPTNIAIAGTWHIESVQGRPVIDYSPAQLTFGEDNQLSGNNSCNQFFGQYQLNGEQLSLSPTGNTMKACVDALMDQEQRVMQAMPLVNQATLAKGKLLLKDTKGKTLLVLSQ